MAANRGIPGRKLKIVRCYCKACPAKKVSREKRMIINLSTELS
jgi:hypothetical protein